MTNTAIKIWNTMRGAVITLLVIAFLELLGHTKIGFIPNPPALLIIAIIYSSFIGGMLPGLLSGLVSWVYIALFFSKSGQAIDYSPENLVRVLVWGPSIALMVFMVSLLKRRAIQAIHQQIEERDRLDSMKREAENKYNKILADKYAAEAANVAKSVFLANMSHEIRTPLGVILGFSEILANEQLSPSAKESYKDAIKRNGALLSSIIDDILDLAKVEANLISIERKSVQVNDLLSDIKTLLSLSAEEKGLQLIITNEGFVPEVIETDPTRLRQILLNIIGNAIKFTHHGSIEVTVKSSIKNEKSVLEFIVKDMGIGIKPEQVPLLFKPFTQADSSTKRIFGGTGLGLVLSRRFAQLLGGNVELIKSEYGKGSVFAVTIDAGNLSKNIHPNSTANNPASNEPPLRLNGVKVLLVEDLADNQILVQHLLTAAKASVDIAENGKVALRKASENIYDVILMDLQMPEMDGYEALSELKKRGYTRPVIALTAHTLKEEKARCLTAGFNAHLSKPINRQELIKTILQHSRQL